MEGCVNYRSLSISLSIYLDILTHSLHLYSIATVVECLAALAEAAARKGFGTKIPQMREEGEWTDEAILKRLTKEQM